MRVIRRSSVFSSFVKIELFQLVLKKLIMVEFLFEKLLHISSS